MASCSRPTRMPSRLRQCARDSGAGRCVARQSGHGRSARPRHLFVCDGRARPAGVGNVDAQRNRDLHLQRSELADGERPLERGRHREPVQHLLASRHIGDAQWHQLQGTVIADASITVGAGANLEGRALAGTGATGAVTMAGSGGNTIGGCSAPAACPHHHDRSADSAQRDRRRGVHADTHRERRHGSVYLRRVGRHPAAGLTLTPAACCRARRMPEAPPRSRSEATDADGCLGEISPYDHHRRCRADPAAGLRFPVGVGARRVLDGFRLRRQDSRGVAAAGGRRFLAASSMLVAPLNVGMSIVRALREFLVAGNTNVTFARIMLTAPSLGPYVSCAESGHGRVSEAMPGGSVRLCTVPGNPPCHAGRMEPGMKSEKIRFRRGEESCRPFNAQAFLDSSGVAKSIASMDAGRTIFTQGDACEHVMYIQTGGVKLSVLSKTGGKPSSRCSARATSLARGAWPASQSGWAAPRPHPERDPARRARKRWCGCCTNSMPCPTGSSRTCCRATSGSKRT